MIYLYSLNSDILILVCICSGLCLIQRLTVSLLVRDSFDTYGHLYFAKLVRNQNTGPFGCVETNALGSNSYSNPFLWHWLITLLGVNCLNRIKKVINPSLDALFSGFIVYSAYISSLDKIESFMCGLIYVFTPMWYSVFSIGPRVTSLTPRLTSEIFFCISLMFIFCPFTIDNTLSVVLSTICFAIVILVSKFGTQVVLFVTPIVIFTTLSLDLFVSLISSLCVCVVVSKGRIFGAFKDQINHLIWYYNNNKNSNTPIFNRNSIKNFLDKIKGKSLSEKLKFTFFFMIRENSYLSTCIKIPFMCYLIYSIFKFDNIYGDNFKCIVISGLLVFVVVNIRTLLFLGEAERYINHISFFVVFVFIDLTNKIHYLVESVLLFSFLFYIIELIYLYWFRKRTRYREEIDLKVIKNIQQHAGNYNIICYPFHAVGVYRILYNTESRVLFPLNNHIYFNNNLGMNYPYLKLNNLFKTKIGKCINYAIIDINKATISTAVIENIFRDWKLLKYGSPFYRIFIKK